MRTRQERSEQTAKEYFLEQATAYFDEMVTAAKNAPHGKIFDHAEAFAVQRGRELIKQSLETMLQEQVDDFEKKKRPSARNARLKNDIAAIDQKKE